ncbi:hypothetical protein MNBD_NITROSPINAE02-1610 [hydrothermal vent metagenome]|uniref:Response regulatory domain-containing protein n=1 Tax=hydrothermal vent metagenome TaxID=652676 RepID=A0A3B1BU58_9ZZZZ
MADIVLAGEAKEDFGGIASVLNEANEAIERIEVEITDSDFLNALGSRYSGVIISRFHEGDLASIKAMQTIRIKKPALAFIFISDKEMPESILTLVFNEGAYGVLQEPVSSRSALQLIKQALKRSKWNMDEISRSADLKVLNKKQKDRIDQLETNLGRAVDLNEKMERLIDFLLSDKSFRTKSVKILFVSDTPYQRGLLMKLFGGMGFNVKDVPSGEEALDVIKSFRPEIVVSDLELGGMTGIELSKEVKGQKGYPYLYFIILTASADKVNFILSPDTFVDDCVVKPSDQERYHEMVAKVALGILTP